MGSVMWAAYEESPVTLSLSGRASDVLKLLKFRDHHYNGRGGWDVLTEYM